jgi:hypothetical protein
LNKLSTQKQKDTSVITVSRKPLSPPKAKLKLKIQNQDYPQKKKAPDPPGAFKFP